ncbi:MAG TPA: hypothetical protein VK893_09865 [Pyrinomonadaceae bacterium]|nr:hypothetical protein [Pyrinomonadaceae bacterium]
MLTDWAKGILNPDTKLETDCWASYFWGRLIPRRLITGTAGVSPAVFRQ